MLAVKMLLTRVLIDGVRTIEVSVWHWTCTCFTCQNHLWARGVTLVPLFAGFYEAARFVVVCLLSGNMSLSSTITEINYILGLFFLLNRFQL